MQKKSDHSVFKNPVTTPIASRWFLLDSSSFVTEGTGACVDQKERHEEDVTLTSEMTARQQSLHAGLPSNTYCLHMFEGSCNTSHGELDDTDKCTAGGRIIIAGLNGSERDGGVGGSPCRAAGRRVRRRQA